MKKIMYIVALMSEISLVAAVFFLEQLTLKKAGVNHHVLARKIQWESSIFSVENIKLMDYVLWVILLGLLLLLLASLLRKPEQHSGLHFYQIQIVLGFLAASTALMSHKASFFLQLKTTPYLTFAALIVLFVQIIILAATRNQYMKKRNNNG